MSSELKIITNKYLEWSSNLPSIDSPEKSSNSLSNRNDCFLRLRLEKQNSTWYFNLYLEFKCELSEFKSCKGKLQIDFKTEEFEVSLGDKTFEVSEPGKKEIWYISVNDLQQKLSSSYKGGNRMKFILSFDEPAPLIIGEVDNKCVQTNSYMNAGVDIESVCEDFSRLLDSGAKHDTEIRCGENSIKAHSIILCSRSEVFKAMLESDMVEGQTGVIEIKDMDISYVQDFIRYLYTGIMPDLTFDKAKALYEAGDKYAAKSLMLRCSEYLQDYLSAENFFQCFTLADAHSDQNLKDGVLAYIFDKKIYLQEEHWSPFCKSYPETALEVYRLSYKNVAETNDQ